MSSNRPKNPIRVAVRRAYEQGQLTAYERAFASLGRSIASRLAPDLMMPEPRITKADEREHGPNTDPDLQSDPHQSLLLAQIDHRIRSMETGADPGPGDRTLHVLWEDPEALSRVLVPHAADEPQYQKALAHAIFLKAWRSDLHPRADDGEFISAGAIRNATRDPMKASALRNRVTNPSERSKLEARLQDSKPFAGQERSEGTSTYRAHQSHGRTSPELHSVEGQEHVDISVGHLKSLIKQGDAEGVRECFERFDRNATVHWGEAKAKAIKQFKMDYPDADLSAVRAAFDTALERTKDGYETLVSEAYDYARLVAKGDERQLEIHQRSYREQLQRAVYQLKDTYDGQQNKVWDAIEATRDALGGKAKGYKLGRYFKFYDSEFDKAAERSPKGGISLKGSFYPGGQWIPSSVIADASPEEKTELAERNQGARPNPLNAREKKKVDTATKRGTRDQLRKHVADIASDIMLRPQLATPDKYRDLAESLKGDHLSVADLRMMRLKLSASFGGGRRKAQMVAALLAHADSAIDELKAEKQSIKENAATVKSRKKDSDTILTKVLDYGGIDPESHELLTSYETMQRAVQDGIPLAAFRKGGRGLDQIARELETNGHIHVPEDEHAGSYVLDLLRERALSLHADLTKQMGKALNEYWKAVTDASTDHSFSEIEEAARSGAKAGRAEGETDPLGQHGGGTGVEPRVTGQDGHGDGLGLSDDEFFRWFASDAEGPPPKAKSKEGVAAGGELSSPNVPSDRPSLFSGPRQRAIKNRTGENAEDIGFDPSKDKIVVGVASDSAGLKPGAVPQPSSPNVPLSATSAAPAASGPKAPLGRKEPSARTALSDPVSKLVPSPVSGNLAHATGAHISELNAYDRQVAKDIVETPLMTAREKSTAVSENKNVLPLGTHVGAPNKWGNLASDLLAVPKGDSRFVGGHRVRRTADGKFQVERRGGYLTGDENAIADHIKTTTDKESGYPSHGESLARAAKYDEPDPFTDPGRASEDAKLRDEVPEGAKAVSLDANTHGRVGTVRRDPVTGKVGLQFDGGEEHRGFDFEPLDVRHSWRAKEEREAVKPKAGKVGNLFG